MERINVVTPFGAAVFIYSKGKLLSMRGPTEALNQWNTSVASILYGTHGHIFFPDRCLFGDLCAALRQTFGRDSISLSQEQESILEQEIDSIPADAVP